MKSTRSSADLTSAWLMQRSKKKLFKTEPSRLSDIGRHSVSKEVLKSCLNKNRNKLYKSTCQKCFEEIITNFSDSFCYFNLLTLFTFFTHPHYKNILNKQK